MPLVPALLACAFLPAALSEPKGDDVRLVVVIGVDQMIPEQLDRLAPFFSGGFARFARDGLVFPEAMLEHGISETGPGYTTLGTGTLPARHGIVSNEWLDAEGERIYCMFDGASAPVVDAGRVAGSGLSPKNVRVPALGDLLRAADADSRVVAIGGKDRSAIGLGGRRPDVCLWWNRAGGGFMTSLWYADELPDWVLAWNADWTDRFDGGEWANGWKLALPDGIERAGTALDENEGEASRDRIEALVATARTVEGERRRALLGQYAFATPIVDLCVVEAAELAVSNLELGQDEHPDTLLLGLSACDIIGHSHGPLSAEVTDQLLRLDRALGQLFDRLDAGVGAEHWIAVLSADHGALLLPPEERRRGVPARVFPASVADATVDAVRGALLEQFGRDLVAGATEDGIRLRADRLAEGGLELAAVRAAAASAARSASDAAGPAGDWLERVFTFEELASAPDDLDPVRRLMAASFDRERSPDVSFVRRPWSLVGFDVGTTHGTPYPYDRRVVLAFLGEGIGAGRRFDRASLTDVVPTLLAWLGVEAPELDGRVLFE